MNRFEDLSMRYYENHLDAAEFAELRGMIEKNPPLLREFVLEGVREEQLKDALRRRLAMDESLSFVDKRARYIKRSAKLLAAAAAVVIAISAWSLINRGVTVEVIRAKDVIFSDDSDSFDVGTRKRVHALSIVKGLLIVRLPNDISIELLAPAEMRFIDPMHAQILSGKATVDVGEKGQGFILDTPQTAIVDLGTRFGVDASTADATGVVVIEGCVELHSRQGKVNHLTEGEGAVVHTSGTFARLDQARFNPRTGQWSTGALDDGSSLIRSVHNNQKDQSVYHIVGGGLIESVPAHHNRNARWVSLPEKSIPPWLIGADLVLPAHNHRNRKNLNVSVTLAPNSTLFIFQRRTQPAPQWLTDQFVPTGEMIGKVSIEKDRENKPVSFEIWRRDMPEGGAVRLGPAARADLFNANTILYGIAAIPLDKAPRNHH